MLTTKHCSHYLYADLYFVNSEHTITFIQGWCKQSCWNATNKGVVIPKTVQSWKQDFETLTSVNHQCSAMLYQKKTEFIVIGTRQQLVKVDIDSLCVGHTAILPSSEVRNLGGLFDNQLKMVTQINQTCKAAFFHIFNIRRIRKFISFDTVQTLVNA